MKSFQLYPYHMAFSRELSTQTCLIIKHTLHDKTKICQTESLREILLNLHLNPNASALVAMSLEFSSLPSYVNKKLVLIHPFRSDILNTNMSKCCSII